jgi:hypothetical protein
MKIQVERIDDYRPPSVNSPVQLKHMGHIFEVRYTEKNRGGIIQKLNASEYKDKRTGEVKAFNRAAKTRADNLITVAQSLRNLRDIINCNLIHPHKCRWVTLTYKENMCCQQKLYNDLDKFTKRLRYYLQKNSLPKMEIITAVEPQARGAFHAHCVLIFEDKAPFIHNDDFAKIWGHGHTKIKSFKGIDNIGLYLTAYLTDLELTEAARLGASPTGSGVKTVSTKDEDGKPVSKAIVKGGRLHLYPAGMRIYRVSKGIKRPTITQTTEGAAMKIIGSAPLTFERTIRVTSNADDTYFNTISYRQFNKKSGPPKAAPSK